MAKQWFKKSGTIKNAPGYSSWPGISLNGLVSLALIVLVVMVIASQWKGDDDDALEHKTDADSATRAASESVSAGGSNSNVRKITGRNAHEGASNNPDEQAMAAQESGDSKGQSSASTRDRISDDKPETARNDSAQNTAGNAAGDEHADKPALEFEGTLGVFIPRDMADELARARPAPEPDTAPDPEPKHAARPPSEAVTGWCKALAERVGHLSSSDCLKGTFVDSGSRSVNGRPLVVRDLQASEQPAVGRVLLIGATHGDEPSSIATVFHWMQRMAQQGTTMDWHILPVLNPDGVLASPSTRVNANGVDLNRNLPTTGWARKSRDYWRRVGFEKRRYPGKAPGSEPENQWLVEQIRDYRPDVIVTLHAPYGILDYDGNFPAPRKLGELRLHRLGVYPGSLGNFASRMQGIPVITVELEDAQQPPSDSEAGRMLVDLTSWLDRYMRSVRQARADAPDEAG